MAPDPETPAPAAEARSNDPPRPDPNPNSESDSNPAADTILESTPDAGEDVVQTKINVKQTFLIGFGFLSCMLAWMVYNFQMPIILAGKLAESGDAFYRVGILGTSASRQLWSGVIMTLDNIVAIVLQPWFGELSDRMESKHGRRTPFMIIGVPIAAASLILLPFTEYLAGWVVALLAFVGVVLVFNLAMAFYRAPIVALMPDMTPAKFRSTGNAIINLMGGVGTGVGFLVPILVGFIDPVQARVVSTGTFATQDFFWEDFTIFTITAGLLLLAFFLFLAFVREVPTGDTFWHLADERIEFDPITLKVIPKAPESELAGSTGEGAPGKQAKQASTEDDARDPEKDTSVLKDLKGVFQEEEKSGVFILLAIFAWFFGFNALEANFSRWTQEYLLLTGDLVGQLFLGLPVALVIVGVPAAKIAEKAGRRKTIKIGLLCMIGALAAMIIVQEVLRAEVLGGNTSPNIWGLAACIAFMGVGWALININSITIVWQLAPKEKVGTYTGLYYFFSQLAAILSPVAMGGLLMVGEMLVGPVYTWRSIVPFMLVSMVVALIFMSRVKRGEAELTEEELEALALEYGGPE